MTRKEKMDLLLSKIPEDRKAAFVAEFRTATTEDAKMEVLRKYGIVLTEEESAILCKKGSSQLSAQELELVSGGCTCACGCGFDG